MDRFSRTVVLGIFVAVIAGAGQGLFARADGDSGFDPSVRPQFSEPVMLASKDGVLEVRLIAHQGEIRLDTVAVPVKNALVFGYELIRGTASNGQMSGDNLYPSPTLQVFPGETLIVHLDNALTGLTIRDFFDPQYTAKGEEVPLYPSMMASSPLNLHVHGVHVSPKGNADNVMLHIPGGASNTYTYNIPKTMPQGAYWYHSHLHGLTTPHVYYGMAGLLAIGRTDGNLPLVTQSQIPIRNMVLQYNYVFDRAGGGAQLNNYSWSQWVSTIKPPEPGELEKGTYRPLLAPVNFLQSKPGTQNVTIWYSGPLSIRNERGRFEFIPSNLQRFTAFAGGAGKDVPANPGLPDYLRDVQFTVNGQFQPVHQEQGGPDRDLGARQCQRHRLHARAADRDGDGQPSQDRHRRPGRGSLSGSPSSRVRERHAAPDSAGHALCHRRHHARRRATSSWRCRPVAAAPPPSAPPACSTPMTARKIRRRCWAA